MPEVRLNKFIADSGFCARRKADTVIAAGRVQVNGRPVLELGTKLDPETDVVTIDGHPLSSGKRFYLAFHKPVGVVTSRQVSRRQKSIYALIPAEYQSADPAGRLDQDSSGLLILSNDGDFLHQVTHPRFHRPKVYEVTLNRSLDRQHIDTLKQGILLKPENKLARMEAVQAASSDSRMIRATLVTGYNRQIRRSFETLGYRVQALHRQRFGPVELADLAPGAIRLLTPVEVRLLKDTERALPPAGTAQPKQGQKAEQEKDRPVEHRHQQPGQRQAQRKRQQKKANAAQSGTRQP